MSPIVTLMRLAWSLARRRSAIAVDSSIPDTRTPRSASGRATRPVPMANSSALPSPANSASRSTVGPSIRVRTWDRRHTELRRPRRNSCRSSADARAGGSIGSTRFFVRVGLPHISVELTEPGVAPNAGYVSTASASISTLHRGSRSPATTTMVAAGRTSANASPCARPTASASARSVMNILVRTTSSGRVLTSARAAKMISRHLCAWTPGSGSQPPSDQTGAVPETRTRSPTRKARLNPMEDSYGESDPMCCRATVMHE